MTNKRISFFVTPTLFAALAIFVATATADEHSGTWKMSPNKSKYSPGPALKNLTETIASDENSYKVEANGTDGDGKPMHIEFSAKFDGKDYPATGVPWADAVSVKRVNACTVQAIQRKRGQVMMTITCEVSTDAKTHTCTLKGKDRQGRAVNNLVVFDKQ